uniref:PABPN1 like, cytoplasmic n=1 Tax=Prolemur simus TaxID=1328070 RepID=A0A8C8Z8I1_PROSS
MWPFLSRALFPPPTEAWLQTVSSDPEAQGWGAWGGTKKTPLGPGDGDGKKEEEAEEEQGEDAGFLLSLLNWEHLAECPVPDQELEAIRLKLCSMEQAAWLPPEHQPGPEEGGTGGGQLLSPEIPGRPFPGTHKEKVEADHRSVYVGNVDYGGTAEELEAHFSHCGRIQRVTILCDKFSGHPKGCCPKGPTSRGSAPRTAAACGGTQAPGGRPSPTAASRAGPGPGPMGRTGAEEGCHRGSHPGSRRTEGRAGG